jgi:hypothetical protein
MASSGERAEQWLASMLGLGMWALQGMACSPPAPSPELRAVRSGSAPASSARLRELRAYEAELRSGLEPRTQRPWLDVSGPNPYRLVARGEGGFVGILAGSASVVALDAQLSPRSTLSTREALGDGPTALCLSKDDRAWIASRYTSSLLRVDVAASMAMSQRIQLSARGVADVACGDAGHVYVLPADGSPLLTLDASGTVVDRRPALAGGIRLLRRGRHLLELSLFERSLRVLELSSRGLPTREVTRISHDGPLWAADAIERDGELLIAVAGVENKPLVKSRGELENIDSFAWIYRAASEPVLVAELNVSESGLVLPKAISLHEANGRWSLEVLAAGSGRFLRAVWPQGLERAAELETEPVPPGASDAVFDLASGVVYASPLLDAWIRVDRRGTAVARVEPDERPAVEVRLGEALFFTELIAPNNDSAGTHSRFSCETCHFEGGVDGRTHFSGRGQVSLVTKPLFGLAQNGPHFSRAMDRDLSSVSHNEVRVAGGGSGTDPWFTLDATRFPWLHELGIVRSAISPLEVRRALLAFLYAFAPPPSPYVRGRTEFSALEAQGAALFEARCETCHAARLLADEAASAVRFEDWQELVLGRSAAIVWAKGEYAKTGVLPYVHERGTRITSLRRLALKPRYFTSGAAPSLSSVLERFRSTPDGALHEAPTDVVGGALEVTEQKALLAFLRLL